MPDHESLFDLLATNLEKSKPSVVVATLSSEHFTNIKNAVISMVSQLINSNDGESDVSDIFNTLYLFIKETSPK